MKIAEDLYDVIIPLYVISKILGLAPFTLKEKCLKTHFGPIVILRVFAVIGGMCYIAVTVETLEYEKGIAGLALRCELYFERVDNLNSSLNSRIRPVIMLCIILVLALSTFSNPIFLVNGTIMTFIVLMLATINQKFLIKSIEKLADIDLKMKSLQVQLNYKNSQKFVLAQVIFITCVFSSKIILQFFIHSAIMLLMYSAFNVVDYINTIMLFQYVDLLLLIRQRLIWMNRRLRRISNLSYPVRTNDFKIPLTPIVCRKYKNILFDKNIDLKTVIRNLGKIYSELCEVSRLVNRTYNIQILVTIGCRFVMITTQLINTYNVIRDPNRGSAVQYALVAMYLALHSSKIFMVASLSENTAAKAKQTGRYLHNIWEVIPCLRDEIEYFSLQILHQDLKFTACDFFILDYTLIYAIVGAITTYLIIVIQLEKAF